MKKVFIVLFGLLLLTSCASRKKVVYLNELEGDRIEDLNSYETTLQPDDVLSIFVNSKADRLVREFNLSTVRIQNDSETGVGQQRLQTYLIDKDGFINFPVIGKIKMGGLTREEAVTKLTDTIKPYIDDVLINIRILNYKVTVQGEVSRPGTFTIDSERVTLFQALSMAGDMTIYGKRKEVLIIREANEKRTYTKIDITNPDFINSEFYYLKQNDVVYVEPNKTQVNSSVIGRDITIAISVVSLLLTIAIATQRF